jgi:outer membrane biosynthesis protein TonB
MERAEKIGLGIASTAHVLLLGLLSITLLRAPQPLRLNNPPIDVSIVDEIALKSAAPKISTEPPPPTQAPDAGPEEQAAPAPEPRLDPAPPIPKVVLRPAPKPEPAPKPRPVENAKPLPKVIAPAPLPKKVAPAKPAAAKPSPPKLALSLPAPSKPKTVTGTGKAAQTRGSRLGPDFLKGIQTESQSTPAKPATAAPAAVIGSAQKAALDAEIRRQLKPYWKSPTGADVEQLRTFVQVDLAKDGSIIGTPQVVDTTGITPSNQGQVRLHREQAVKAIKLAAPLRLPPDLYSGWKSLRISFDKRLSQ